LGSLLNFEPGVSLASAHVNSQEVLCCTLLPAQALSRGSDYVHECADEFAPDEINTEHDKPESKRVCEVSHEPDEDDPATVTAERQRLEDEKGFEWAKHQTVRAIEPLPQTINIEDYLEIERLRHDWLRKVTAVQVSLNHGCVSIAMCQASDNVPVAGYMLTDSGVDAGKVSSLSDAVRQLWQMQDFPVWQVDLDNPSLSQAMNGPHKEHWWEAIQTEIGSLNEMRTYELVDRPKGKNAFQGHFVLKIKRKETVRSSDLRLVMLCKETINVKASITVPVDCGHQQVNTRHCEC
jgi:hypothetical protein